MPKPKSLKNPKGKTPQQRHQTHATSRLQESNPNLEEGVDGSGNTSQDQTSGEDEPASLSLFEQFVISVEETNCLKRCMNLDKRLCRKDLDNVSNVSSDEKEEDLPNKVAFDLLAKGLHAQTEQPQNPVSGSNTHIPTSHTQATDVDEPRQRTGLPSQPPITDHQPGPTTPAIDWPAMINAVQGAAEHGSFPQQGTIIGNFGDEFTNMGHIFKADAIKPEYELNARTILKPILQMAYLKLFIPLSL